MRNTTGGRWLSALIVAATGLLPVRATAHPGSGIVIDRLGQVYFVDMVSGIWKIDVRGVLTHLPGQAFHWMTLDEGNRFGAVQLPSGSDGDFARIGTNPTLLLASDYPIAMGRDGNLYYPSHGGGAPLQILRLQPSGQGSRIATLPATTARGPLRDVNGLAADADGALYFTENDAIHRISKEGRVSTVAQNISLASCPSRPERGDRDRPLLRGLDVDDGGMIYVAETLCGSVLKVTPAGQVSVLFQVESPWSPTGIALFGKDVYVLEFLHAESDNRREMVPRVRKITPDGKTSIVATVTRR